MSFGSHFQILTQNAILYTDLVYKKHQEIVLAAKFENLSMPNNDANMPHSACTSADMSEQVMDIFN